jgi:ABC-type branched-subunit amino acid transport system ATPase component
MSTEPLAASLIVLRDASVTFGAVAAVRKATMRVRERDFIAIVGANGSGKTSLLRLLHGVVAHTGSRFVPRPSVVQAMVFQRPFLLRLSVLNNVRIALWLADRHVSASGREARADTSARTRRPRRLAPSAGAFAFWRRAAAPGPGARLGGAPGHPLPRRTDRQP